MPDWYRHLPEHIDPIVFSIGFFSLHWYAVMYLLSLGIGGYVLWRQTRGWLAADPFLDLLSDSIIGILVGARIGYVLLYNLPFYVAHPAATVWPFDSVTGEWIGIAGMSFYGGLIGAALGIIVFSRSHNVSFWKVADRVAFAVPIGYVFGRIGNFLNGELYGRVTDSMAGMYFPDIVSGVSVLRHPSALYEAFFEGAGVFLVLLAVRRHYRFSGAVASASIVAYGFFRVGIECFREPDPQIGFLFGAVTLGQLLSVTAVVGGLGLFHWLRRKEYGTIESEDDTARASG